VLSPGFKVDNIFTEWERIRLQIEIPLKAVIKFSKKFDKPLTYGVHTQIILGDMNCSKEDFEKVKVIFLTILKNENLY
jgi:hypothetical protein